jgi:uncharacterized protein involved in exopolysaccharide biosynthesis
MPHATIGFADVIRTVQKHRRLVAGPVIALTLVSLVYAILRPKVWEASQALVVRDEAGDPLSRPGKFAHLDEMKTSQETILELARSRGVLTKALNDAGRGTGHDTACGWSDERSLERLQGRVKVTPPVGAEFGKTEVFYLKVQDEDRDRAVALATAICGQLQDRLAALREATAKSTTDELTRSVSLARDDLTTATRTLAELEQSVGNDLAELRILSESPSGDGDLRRNLLELEKELRAYCATQTEYEESLKLLRAAQADPEKLLASPSVLLKSQPALARLKDGLVDAQLRTGQALGTMSLEHPLVLGARESERAIREQVHDEIGAATEGVEADLRVGTERIRALEAQKSAIQDRLSRLAGLRAEYSNRAAEVRHRGETLKAVQHELAEARASQASARASSRIGLVDVPDGGTRPLGPGRTMIVASGFLGGVLIAAAFVFLLIGPGANAAKAATLEAQVAPAVGASPSTNGHRPQPVRKPAKVAGPSAARAAGPLTLRQALELVAVK